jgi:predicted nicotinamide N-methyase
MAFADEADLFESMMTGERVAELLETSCNATAAFSVRRAAARELAELLEHDNTAVEETRATDFVSRLTQVATACPSAELSADLLRAAQLCAPQESTATVHSVALPHSGRWLHLQTLGGKSAALGGRLWTSSQLLVTHVLVRIRDAIVGARILELGAGAGYCGLAALHMGAASVTLTDCAPDVVDLLVTNAAANPQPVTGITAKVEPLDWLDVRGNGPRLDPDPGFDIVLASDVLYHDDQAEPLATTVAAHLCDTGVAHVLCPVRSAEILDAFVSRASSLGLHITRSRVKSAEKENEYEFEYIKLERPVYHG